LLLRKVSFSYGEVKNRSSELRVSSSELGNPSSEVEFLYGEVKNPGSELGVSSSELGNPSSGVEFSYGEVKNPGSELGVSSSELGNPSSEVEFLYGDVKNRILTADALCKKSILLKERCSATLGMTWQRGRRQGQKRPETGRPGR